MTEEGWIVAGIVGVVGGGLWVWQKRRVAEDWRRIKLAVSQLSGGGDVQPPEFHDQPRFGGLMEDFLHMMRHQREERDRLQHEAVNQQTILQSMDEGVMVVDSKHMIRFVNPAFKTILTVESEPIGETVLATLKDDDFDEIISAVLRTGAVQEREISPNGGRPVRHFAVSAMPLREAKGNPGVVMILRDVTRLRQLEDVRKEFVANVSHELRTPLSIFQGYTETLIDNPELPPEDTRPMLEIMRKHSRRLNALVEDLLILARLESRDEKLHLAPLDVAKFLRESVTDWSMRSAEKKIALTANVTPGTPTISADAFRLEQVMGNLIENAIKYTNTGGRVTVRAFATDDGVEIRVEDTGLGIPAADVPRIFERFYRADKGRSREHGGTGLGLSIVKHIVLAHGGSVHAESEVGRGTSIILRLPKKPPTPGATPPTA